MCNNHAPRPPAAHLAVDLRLARIRCPPRLPCPRDLLVQRRELRPQGLGGPVARLVADVLGALQLLVPFLTPPEGLLEVLHLGCQCRVLLLGRVGSLLPALRLARRTLQLHDLHLRRQAQAAGRGRIRRVQWSPPPRGTLVTMMTTTRRLLLLTSSSPSMPIVLRSVLSAFSTTSTLLPAPPWRRRPPAPRYPARPSGAGATTRWRPACRRCQRAWPQSSGPPASAGQPGARADEDDEIMMPRHARRLVVPPKPPRPSPPRWPFTTHRRVHRLPCHRPPPPP